MKSKKVVLTSERSNILRRLTIKSFILAAVIVMMLPLVRSPSQFMMSYRSIYGFGELLGEEKIAPDTYAVFYTWETGQFSCDLIGHKGLKYEHKATIFGNWPCKEWSVSKDFESQGIVCSFTFGFLPEGSSQSNDERITYIGTDYGGKIFFTVTEQSSS